MADPESGPHIGRQANYLTWNLRSFSLLSQTSRYNGHRECGHRFVVPPKERAHSHRAADGEATGCHFLDTIRHRPLCWRGQLYQ